MRWVVALLVAALLWTAYAASPYVALWRLARAVQDHDVAVVAERVNFRALRASLTRQMTAAAAASAIAARREGAPRDRQFVVEAAASLAEPLVAALVTPETVVDILDDGWPEGLALPRRPTLSERVGGGLDAKTLRDLRDLFLASDMHGFRTVLVSFPPREPRERRFRLRLRLRGTTWRLVDLELPAALRDEISRRLVLTQPDAGGGAPGGAAPDGETAPR